MKTQSNSNAGGGCSSHDLLCSSVPARLPDGRTNPEYARQYQARRKAAGNPVKHDPEYWKEYRDKRKAAGNPVKTYARSPEAIKRWNESEKGKAARAKYEASPKYKRRRRESGEAYAARIIRDMEEIYQHNFVIRSVHWLPDEQSFGEGFRFQIPTSRLGAKVWAEGNRCLISTIGEREFRLCEVGSVRCSFFKASITITGA